MYGEEDQDGGHNLSSSAECFPSLHDVAIHIRKNTQLVFVKKRKQRENNSTQKKKPERLLQQLHEVLLFVIFAELKYLAYINTRLAVHVGE